MYGLHMMEKGIGRVRNKENKRKTISHEEKIWKKNCARCNDANQHAKRENRESAERDALIIIKSQVEL